MAGSTIGIAIPGPGYRSQYLGIEKSRNNWRIMSLECSATRLPRVARRGGVIAPNEAMKVTEAAICVSEESLSLGAAAVAELQRSARNTHDCVTRGPR